jgi:hypothetical protein
MSVPEVLAYVAAGTTSVSAVAAAVSARTNLRSVRRANLPLVYGEPGYGRKPGGYRNEEEAANAPVTDVFVVLHNDGPGTAIEVRCCLRTTSGDWQSDPIDAIRAMRPGESVPADSGFRFSPPWREDSKRTSWGVATRFRDTDGGGWETFNQRFPPGGLTTQRLRSSRWQVRRAKTDW